MGHIEDNPNHLQASGGNRNNRGKDNQQNTHTQNAYYAPPILGNNSNSYYTPPPQQQRHSECVIYAPQQVITRRTTHTCEKHGRPTPSAGDVAAKDTSAEIFPIGLPHQRQNLNVCSNPGGTHPFQKTNGRAGRRKYVTKPVINLNICGWVTPSFIDTGPALL